MRGWIGPTQPMFRPLPCSGLLLRLALSACFGRRCGLRWTGVGPTNAGLIKIIWLAGLLMLAWGVPSASAQEQGADSPPAFPAEPGAMSPSSRASDPLAEPSWLRALEAGAGPVGRDARYFPGAGIFDGGQAGLRIGDTLVSGTFSGSAAFDSNVDSGGGGDPGAVLATNLSVSARPILERHSLAFTGSVSATGALPQVQESDIGLNLGAAGTLDLSRRDKLDATATFTRMIESPTSTGSGDLAAADSPAQTGNRASNQLSATSTYRRLYPRASLSAGPSVTTAFYEDDSSENYVQPGFVAAYSREIDPKLSGVVSSDVSRTIYPDEAEDGSDRNSTIVGASVGVDYRPRESLSANLAVGVERIEYDESDRQGRTGLTFSGGLRGRLGERTSATVTASRSFDATTTVQDADVATVTELNATLERVLSSSLRGDAQLGLAVVDYLGADRTDYVVDAGIGLSYAVTGNTALTAGVSYAERFSDESGDGVREFVATVGFVVGF